MKYKTYAWCKMTAVMLAAIFFIQSVFIGFLSISSTPSVEAAPLTITKTTQADFMAGKYEFGSVDTTSATGDLKLASDSGTWNASGSADLNHYPYVQQPMTKVGRFVYMFRNTATGQFMRYDLDSREWKEMAFVPTGMYEAVDMTTNGTDTIYAFATRYSTGPPALLYKTFLKYDIPTNTWSYLADAPDYLKSYTALEYVPGSPNYIYAIQGNSSYAMWRYNVSTNTWSTINTGNTVYCQNYCDLVYDGSRYLYWLTDWQNPDRIYRYDTTNGIFTRMADAPIDGAFTTGLRVALQGDYIYALRGAGTQTFYRYQISANTWTTFTNVPYANYASIVGIPEDNKLIVYESPTTFVDYYPSSNTWSDPFGAPTYGQDTGQPMAADASGNLLFCPGNGGTACYKYSISGNTWTATSAAPASFNAGVSVVWSAPYFYVHRGNNGNSFYRYDPSGNTWATMNAPSVYSMYQGSGMVASDSASIWAIHGNGQTYFSRYDITGNSWASKTALPEGTYRGAGIVKAGSNIYVLSGYTRGYFMRYNETLNTWTRLPMLPVGGSYGGGIAYDGADTIYALVGGDTDLYSRQFYKYSISQNIWTRIVDTPEKINTGAALAWSNGALYVLQGNYSYAMWKYTPPSGATYRTTGSWYSPVYDLTAVTGYNSFTASATTPGSSTATYYSRTSADGNSWSAWTQITGGAISSPANKFIQIKVSLSGDGSVTPTVSDFTITYTGDTTAPDVSSIGLKGYSDRNGTQLTSGSSYSYRNPFFTWNDASDTQSGIDGYYTYFGTNSLADPAASGTLQYTKEYRVTMGLTKGTTYYFIIKAKDKVGNVSSATVPFAYTYTGISPYTTTTITNQLDWDSPTASKSAVYTGSSAWWNGQYAYRKQLTLTAGASPIYATTSAKINIDTSVLETGGKVRSDRRDWRVMYWDNTNWTEVPIVYANTSATYFNPVKKINPGQSDSNYYVYYGNPSETASSSAALISKWGSSLYFNGNNRVEIPNVINGLNTVTIEGWFHYVNTNTWRWIFAGGSSTVQVGASVASGGNTIRYHFNGSGLGNGSTALSPNTWYHIAYVYTSSTVKGYINGQLDFTASVASSINAAQQQAFGGGNWGNNEYFLGSLDEFRISNVARYTSAFTPQTVPFSSDANTLALYHFDDDAGQTLTDSSGNNKNGTLGSTAGVDANDPVWAGSLVASAAAEQSVSNSDVSLQLQPLSTGSWASYQLPALPYAASMYYGTSAVAKNSVFVIKGYNTQTFYKLDLATSTWTQLSNTPATMYIGTALVYDGNDSLYALRGYGGSVTQVDFYKYSISTNTWSTLASIPNGVYAGGSLTMVGNDTIYAFSGNGSQNLFKYTISTNTWSSQASAPAGANAGAGLAYDGNGNLWAVFGGGSVMFAKYVIAQDSWDFSTIGNIPYPIAGPSNNLLYDGAGNLITFTNYNYETSKDSRHYIWKYNIASKKWNPADTTTNVNPIVGAVAYDGNQYAYVMQGYNITGSQGTRAIYRYNVKTNTYLPDTPPIETDRDFINSTGNTYYYQPNTESSLAYDGNDIVYYLQGASSWFKKYVVSEKKWYTMPPLPCYYTGTGAQYANGYLYVACGNTRTQFIRFNSALNGWETMADTPDTINSSGGQGMVYDGNNTLYLLRGNGTSTLYKYNISGNTWTTESTTIPGTIGSSYGASIVYDGSGALYVARGNNTASFYKYVISTQTWYTLSAIPGNISYGSGSVFFNNQIFLIQGNQTQNMYVYDIASDTWLTGPTTPSRVYNGGAFVKGPGNTGYALQGELDFVFWKFNFPTSSSSYKFHGVYTSKAFDLGAPYAFAGFSGTIASPAATMINFETRTSTDSASWSNWVQTTDMKVNSNTNYSYGINSPIARYLQIRATLDTDDSSQTPVVSDMSISYYTDSSPPTNPDILTAYSSATRAASIATDSWHNYAAPTFDWAGASDGNGSGVTGYYVYFGNNVNAIASISGTLQSATSYTASLTTDGEYYLKIQTVDAAGNISAAQWEPFHYRYDATPPPAIPVVGVDPRSYTSTDNFRMFWLPISDATSNATSSGVLGYYYKTATSSGALSSDQQTDSMNPTSIDGITSYRDGENVFSVRVRDMAGNYSPYTQATYYFNGIAPSAPRNLTVYPTTSSTNTFSFTWDEPESYRGSIGEYRYSLNKIPTETNISTVSARLLNDYHGDQVGKNTLYVVGVDEAGNVNYGNYASVDFYADTKAPSTPLNPESFDNSIRATKQYRIGLTWDDVVDKDSSFAGYAIYASATEAECAVTPSAFTLVGTTAGNSYVVTSMNGQPLSSQTYYLCVKAYNTAKQYSSPSTTVSMLPTGRWLTPPDLTSGPATSVKTKSVTITWSTSRDSNSFVKYGTSPGNYTQEIGSSDQVSSHMIKILNLVPGTTYYYKVLWTDEDGNIGSSAESTFQTNPAPFVSDLKVINISLRSAYVSFTIKNASKATIEYGRSVSYGTTTTISTATSETSPLVPLDSLEPGSTYHLHVVAEDDENNTFTGDDYVFDTLPVPKISSLKVQQVSGMATATLRIIWSTNTNVSEVVTYYPVSSPDAAKDQVSLALKKNHEMILKNLQDQTEYTIVVKGKDKAGNEAVATPVKVTTMADMRPPAISNLLVESTIVGLGDNAKAQVNVSWDTDESATSQVEYAQGTGTTYSQATQEDSNRTSNHNVTITGLSPAKIYHLRVVTKDKAGNVAQSQDTVVITPKSTQDALNLVVNNLSKTFGFLKKMKMN